MNIINKRVSSLCSCAKEIKSLAGIKRIEFSIKIVKLAQRTIHTVKKKFQLRSAVKYTINLCICPQKYQELTLNIQRAISNWQINLTTIILKITLRPIFNKNSKRVLAM